MSTTTMPLPGPEGVLEATLEEPPHAPRFVAVVAHPHPLYGGTMDNLVVVGTVRALVAAGAAALRFNFRGVGASAGTHDNGDGERADLVAATAGLTRRFDDLPLLLAGYSFGAAVALRLLESRRSAQANLGPVDSALVLAPPLSLYDFGFLHRNRVPLALICGERDELTPADAVGAAERTWAGLERVAVVAGAGHDLAAGIDGGEALQAALESCLAALGHPRSIGGGV